MHPHKYSEMLENAQAHNTDLDVSELLATFVYVDIYS